ncbi:MAG: hypothetical protein AAFY21_04890, partial [Cyanobacteria bacterium J06641_2]
KNNNLKPEQIWEPQNNLAVLAHKQQVSYSSVDEPSYIEESRQVRQQSASPTINVEPLENVEVLSQQSTSAKDLVLSRKIKQESRQNTVAQVKPSRTIEFSRTAQEEPVKKTPTVTVPTAVSLAGINNKPNVAPEIEQTRKKVVVAQNQEDATQKQIDEKIAKLRNIKKSFYSSPGMSVYIPVGYGSDRNTAFVTTSYQSRVRFADADDGAIGFGVGLGNAKKSVGVVLSYTAASFGGSRDFGSGGFNVKVHRQFKGGWAAAVGMNGFLNVGDYKDSSISGVNDFENSLYAVGTKIFRTRDNINKPFSRVAVSAGVGNGQFRTEDSILNDKDNFNVFGNVAVRIHPRASLIAEWTGQDLALGASIAPFKNIPLVITPAVRDITGPGPGASDRARFILGAGLGFRF